MKLNFEFLESFFIQKIKIIELENIFKLYYTQLSLNAKKVFLGIKALKNTHAYQLVINLLVSIKERNFDYMSILEQRILKNKTISRYFKQSILYNTLTDKEISRILHCFLLYSD
jgi:hypothetical protein